LKTLLLALLMGVSSQGASAATCTANDNAARILSSPSPNDIHPDWSGESYVGLSWYFEPTGYAADHTGDYLKGNLFSPRGGLINPGVFILKHEWTCD
jgi:hypothetical protein